MKIEILGTGCPKCRQLEQNARDAAAESGVEIEIVKISELSDIMNYGVMMTPALAIDGEVRSTGKVLTKDDIKKLIMS
ncbi:TM0996/MTH895 family glutaredoxin-like protein [bacterium]|nr:thioredoxin family protein [Candidatus Omnitrophota bacterium]MBU2528522.1 TM0996/MTH895 family glutaredoxin-like protein [bacterium]MBU3929884.1 TM0996/MTH895 family glutaredoxin-like protein [bacterium]MBU4122374.1 TM0996/MTH895 family glutaredoxin-like protein [bacterium]